MKKYSIALMSLLKALLAFVVLFYFGVGITTFAGTLPQSVAVVTTAIVSAICMSIIILYIFKDDLRLR
jgi:hypothetical protein